MAVPKTQRSSSKKRSRHSQPKFKVSRPQLTRTKSGKLVPMHMVTPDNPFHKGTKFINPKKNKKKQAA